MSRRFRSPQLWHRVGLTVVVAMATATACAPGSSDESSPESGDQQEEGPATLTVWTDATRRPGFEAYQEAHPDVTLNIETMPEDFQQRLLLANQAGEGWPDVTWDNPPGVAVAYASPPFDFAADISDYVQDDVLEGYMPGTLENCLGDDGEVYCLRNDIAPLVVFYDAELMDEFGYDVPTTWEEFEALSLRLADEHPEYAVSFLNPMVPMAASRCPMHEIVDEQTMKVDLQDPKCTRMASLMDSLAEAGATPPLKWASPEFTAEYGAPRKVLMHVGPVFNMGKIQDDWEWPDRVLGVAPPLRWEDEDEIYNYSHGGGFYTVSRHTEFPQAATDLVLWMATGEFQEQTFTLPAYSPMQPGWIERNTDFFADPAAAAEAVQQAADTLWEERQDMPVLTVTQQATQVLEPVVYGEGKTVTETLPAWEEAIVQEATAAGWTVVGGDS